MAAETLSLEFSDGGELPPELHASVQRHRAHLAELVASLRQAGLSDELINDSVRDLIESYRSELTDALRALRAGSDHA